MSLDTGAVFLARRAAEIDGLSVSAWMSQLVRRHAWESQRPRLSGEQQARADEQTAAADEREEAAQAEDRRRRAAG
ncbi:MAG TPA: hypothetical protein VN327_01625 [Pseudonocardiaceae bacterium]|nr:hypothetical protein [Pseudonocardiaceae bacterium]